MVVNVTVSAAQRAHREVLEQLLELNAYEFSGFDQRPIGNDGRYRYEYLDLYWTADDRWPYIAWVDDEVAGFALIRSEAGLLSVAEFLVLPKFRRGGVGTTVARALFERHLGTWEIHQIAGNPSATAFWRQAIPVPFDEKTDDAGNVAQRFSS